MSAIDVDEAAEGGANRVLIVDDDVDFAEGLELLLMGEGYEIEQAHSVVEARRRLEHFNADVALIDICLGGGDGIGLIPQLKTRRPDLLCVMMTAFASTDSVILALQRGAYDYLRKPIQGSDLLATLGRCFDVRRLVSDKAQAEAALFTRNQELEQINARLRMVVGSMRLLTNCESLSELGRRILEEVARNMDADGGSVYLLEDDKLVLHHALDPGHADPVIPLPLKANSVFERALATGRPCVISNIADSPDLAPSGWSGYGDRSILAFPMIGDDGRCIGVLSLHAKEDPPFTPQDRDIGLNLDFLRL